jgi:hypothetical protein
LVPVAFCEIDRIPADDPAQPWRPSRAEIQEYREKERMEIEKLNRPELRSVHRIVWHPKIGDVRMSNVHVTVEAVTASGPWLRVTGQPVLVVDWATWGRMVDAA